MERPVLDNLSVTVSLTVSAGWLKPHLPGPCQCPAPPLCQLHPTWTWVAQYGWALQGHSILLTPDLLTPDLPTPDLQVRQEHPAVTEILSILVSKMALLVCVQFELLGHRGNSKQASVSSITNSSHVFLIATSAGTGHTRAFLFNCFLLGTNQLLAHVCFYAPNQNPVFLLCVFWGECDQATSGHPCSVTEVSGMYSMV